jgi:hypothetical protein
MLNTRKWRWFIGTSLTVIIAVIIGGLSLFTGPAVAQNPCGTTWYMFTSREERDRCAKEKAAKIDQEMQGIDATARTHPAPVHVEVDPRVNGTPVPPGFIPESEQRVEPVDLADVAEIPALRQANSVWRVGAIQAQDQVGYNPLYLWTAPASGDKGPLIGLYLLNDSRKQYNQMWEGPRNIGTITITDVKGINTKGAGLFGIVSFKTASGKTATFNLATHAWNVAP